LQYSIFINSPRMFDLIGKFINRWLFVKFSLQYGVSLKFIGLDKSRPEGYYGLNLVCIKIVFTELES
jgi:hypothetical protein